MCDNRSNKIRRHFFRPISAHRHIAVEFVDEKCTIKFIDMFLVQQNALLLFNYGYEHLAVLYSEYSIRLSDEKYRFRI